VEIADAESLLIWSTRVLAAQTLDEVFGDGPSGPSRVELRAGRRRELATPRAKEAERPAKKAALAEVARLQALLNPSRDA
jgi:hypothetical protein